MSKDLYKKYLDFVIRKRPVEAYDSNPLHFHIIYSLQILGNIMVTLLGFKTEGHRAGGVTLMLGLGVWLKLPRIGARAQAMSADHSQLPGLGDQEGRSRFSDTHLLLRRQGNTLKMNVKVRLKMFIRTALLLNWGNFIWKIH